MKLRNEFVEYIPEQLRDGTIYISIPYATAVHRCCCGCGSEVVTQLSPAGWTLSFNGESVSLDPSIGNWSFPCQSHYWIRNGEARWARRWSAKEIAAGRANDQRARQQQQAVAAHQPKRESFWRRLKKPR